MNTISPSAAVIDGKAHAAALRQILAAEVAALQRHGVQPGLAVVLVGADPASEVYVRSKVRACGELGILSLEHRLPAETSEAVLLALVYQLNRDPTVHGILVQLPLPAAIDSDRILAAIDPAKDVDGFHPLNSGLLAAGRSALVPCTPLGCLLLLKDRVGDLTGLEAVVIGRSAIVGRPMAHLLTAENATVTLAHSKTRDLATVVRRADIVIAAVGRPGMVRGGWLKPGAVVIDVGINRVIGPDGKTRLVGDVAYEEALPIASALTPVPGGVGPMTIACLMQNTITACRRQHGLPPV